MKAYLFLLFVVVTPCFGQDLVITNVTGATAVDKYAAISFTLTIQNTGIVSTQTQVKGAVYLSNDELIDANDFRLREFNVPKLTPDESKVISYVDNSSLTVRHLINNGLTVINSGSYNLIFKIDSDAQLIETDEENNTIIVPEFTVSEPNVNLKFNDLSLSSYAVTAQSGISAIFEASNTGTTDLSWVVLSSFYLSDDQVLSEDDVFVGFTQSNLLTGVDVFTNNMTDDKLIIPNVTPGQYFIIGNVDDQDGRTVFVETDETDNLIVSDPITVSLPSIDITPTQLSVFSIDHYSISGDLTIKNLGSTAIEEFSIGGYLSTSSVINDYAVFLNTYNAVGTIDGNGESRIYFNFTHFSVDDRTIPYTLFITINEWKDVTETDYTNNSISLGNIYIPNPPFPSWDITNMTLADAYDNTDKELSLAIDFLNSGTAYSSTQNFKVVIKDAANNIKHTSQKQQYLAFSPQTQETKNWSISLNDALPVGQYTIEISCATTGGCNTNTYSIPLTINQVQYALTGNIQGEDGVPITKGKLFLYQQRVNGLVEFIDKVVPTINDQFNFQIDEKAHTLFFIPDRTDFPDYAPTIYGKTVTLKPTSFFTLTGNDDLTFEILKVNPGPAGNKTIGGTVADETAAQGRFISAQATSTELLPVILLSETSEVLAVTETDANGAYQFADLSPGKYQVIVAFELDQFIVPEPTPVDVTLQSATLDFSYGGSGVGSIYQPVLEDQSIEFHPLEERTFGDASFQLTASTSSNLELTYTSSNPAVAEVQNNIVNIVGAGTTVITASQSGNMLFNPALEREEILIVNKANQSIDFSELSTRKTTDLAFQLTASSTSGFEISFSSDNESVATVEGNIVTIKGAGQANIKASQQGNQNYNSAFLTRVLNVSLDTQTIIFSSVEDKVFGDEPFEVSATSSSGLPVSYVSSNPSVAEVNGNVVTILSAGETVISAIQDGDLLYEAADNVSHTLTVLKAEQDIIFNELSERKTTSEPFQLAASSSSGLEIYFSSDNENVATVEGNIVTIKGEGQANIKASQQGNQNYNSAFLTRVLNVSLDTQTIIFSSVEDKVFGDEPFEVSATSTSGLPVSYVSSNPSVAEVNGNVITIVSAGETIISAKQDGDLLYAAANTVGHKLTILKADQIINFSELPELKRTDEGFQLTAFSTSGLPISFISGNEFVAKIIGSSVVILGSGLAEITAIQEGNQNFNTAIPVTQILEVDLITSLESSMEFVRISPNPTSGMLFIYSSERIEEIYILDLFGRKVKACSITQNAIDITELVPGIYLLYVKIYGSERQSIQRIIKQ